MSRVLTGSTDVLGFAAAIALIAEGHEVMLHAARTNVLLRSTA